jgi:hypothetical protein
MAAIDGKTLALGGPTFVWMTPDLLGPDPKDSAGMMRVALQLMTNLSGVGFVFDTTGVGERISSPSGVGRKINSPRLYRLDDENLAVMWSEDTTFLGDGDGRLWYFTTNGKQWSEPRLLLRGTNRWTRHESYSGALRSKPAYAAVRSKRNAPDTVSVGFLDGAIWRTLNVPLTGSLSAVSAVQIGRGLVILVQGLTDSKYGISTLLLAPKDSSSLEVMERSHLDSATDYHGTESFLIGLKADSVLAGWTNIERVNGDPVSVLHSSLSTDGGRTWKTLPLHQLMANADELRAERDANGTVHLVYWSSAARILGGPGSIQHAAFRDGTWRYNGPVTTREAHAGVIGSSPQGIVVTWAEYEQQWKTVTAPRTYASWLKKC